MKQQPSRSKYRKRQKGNMSGLSHSGVSIDFGDFGIKALDRGWITSNQIEACRVAITRTLKRKGRVIIRIFPDKPISKKPAETRMGKGKGTPSQWVAVVKPGRILFEVGEVSEEEARAALRKAAGKLPINTRFEVRKEQV